MPLVSGLCRQHMRTCTLTGSQLFQDILSYNPPLIGCSELSSDEDVAASTGRPQEDVFWGQAVRWWDSSSRVSVSL